MAKDEKEPKELELTAEKIDDAKLNELLAKFNQLMKDFMEEGYVLQPFCQSGIRIVRVQKKRSILNPLRR